MNYSEKEIEEVLNKYKLTEDEHKKYYEVIKRLWTADQYPVENPIAVIIGGQTGAGKSGLISYSQKMFPDNNVVIINSDEIKPFHPYGEEIAKKYPELYTKVTDQESNTWTSKLFEDVRNEKYNLIFEGTMKNNRIADEAIPILQGLGYTVVVRGLAVSGLESRLSIHERYEGQVKHKGWGRLVVPEHHNQTFNGMPNTIEYIEQNGKEVFVPQMPVGVGNQNFENWSNILNQLDINENTVIIAHSIAPIFVCKYLITNQIKVKKLIFVCGFNNYLGIDSDFDTVNEPMFIANFDDVKKYCEDIVCYYSDNDPYVKYDVEKEFADKLTDKQYVIKNGGHINEETGYTKFEEILKEI